MSHLEEEGLAGLALGEAHPEASRHVAECPECAAELEELRAMMGRLSGMEAPTGALLTPPARVWDAIVDDVRGDESVADTPASPAGGDSGGSADELAQRRRPAWVIGVAAAAGVAVGAVGVGAVLTFDSTPASTVVAQAELTDLLTEQPAGTAVVEERADGSRVLVLDTEVTEPEDAYLEVWLIDENVDGMISLGHLAGGEAEFLIPAGFDVGAFPIVDVSVEPLDGVPTHSGDSVTRGVLDA